MKALIILLMLALPVSAENSFPSDDFSLFKNQLDRLATRLLLTSSEAEVEFNYQQRQSACQCKPALPNGPNMRLAKRKIEQIYHYRIIYRKTPDGRLHYLVEFENSVNGKFRSCSVRA